MLTNFIDVWHRNRFQRCQVSGLVGSRRFFKTSTALTAIVKARHIPTAAISIAARFRDFVAHRDRFMSLLVYSEWCAHFIDTSNLQIEKLVNVRAHRIFLSVSKHTH